MNQAQMIARGIWTRRLTKLGWWIAVAFAFLLAILSLIPLLSMITSSFSPPLGNWEFLLKRMPSLRWLLNSFIVGAGVSLGGTFTAALAGYTFGKTEFPGRIPLFWLLIITMTVPMQVSLIPLFILMKDLNWFDTYQSMILPYLAFPFGIFLLTQFVQSIPDELIDAAKIDGASEFRLFWTIMLPLMKPALGALAIIAFMRGWNDYWWQLLVVNKDEMLTLLVALGRFIGLNRWGSHLLTAGATLAFIPILLVFLLFQGYFEKGITVGAVKG